MDYLIPYIPILMLLIIAVLFGVVTLSVSSLIGPKRFNRAKLLAYECGNEPEQIANIRLPIKFYLVGLLFLLFDMETVLILCWALAFRNVHYPDMNFQLYALGAMAVFMVILVVGFLYEWAKGALKWN
jgi:NADH-quinone oxidoreductase subunit A